MFKIVIPSHREFDHPVKYGDHFFASELADKGHKILWLVYEDEVVKRSNIPDDEVIEISKNIFTLKVSSLLPLKFDEWFNSNFAAKYAYKFFIKGYKKIKNLLSRHGWDKVDVFWLRHPMFYSVKSLFDYRLFLFRIVDKFSGHTHIGERIKRLENLILKEADLIITPSFTLRDFYKATFNPDKEIYVVTNGANIKHLEEAEKLLKESLLRLRVKRPYVIYVGGFKRLVDYDKLKYVIPRFKDIDFVFVGPVDDEVIFELGGYSNVKLLGTITGSYLFVLLLNAVCGIVPLLPIEIMKYVLAMKTFDYWAAGLPVVYFSYSSDSEASLYYKDKLFLYNTSTEFLSQLDAALGVDESVKSLYRDFARRNSWTVKAQEVEKLIIEHL